MKGVAIWLPALMMTVGCVPPAPQRTQLEIREFQTRTYDTADTAMVMKAVLGALQDDGFIINTANTDLGLITASKEKTGQEGNLGGFPVKYSWACSVNVTPFGQQTKVRVNVQVSEAHGQEWFAAPREAVSQIDDPTYYQALFSRVDKSIFIQKERL